MVKVCPRFHVIPTNGSMPPDIGPDAGPLVFSRCCPDGGPRVGGRYRRLGQPGLGHSVAGYNGNRSGERRRVIGQKHRLQRDQLGILDARSPLYLVLNTFGSAILACDALTAQEWGFLTLEGTWALISK